jgi:YHS domain-containing protein
MIFAHLTNGLALLILGTYAAAGSRKEIGLTYYFCSARDITLFNEFDETRYVHSYRASAHTQRSLALEATHSLNVCLLITIPDRYFIKIGNSDFRRA